MPTTKKQLPEQCLNSFSSNFEIQEALCPGWEDEVSCIGFDTQYNAVSCRSCEPEKESWVSLDYGSYKGVCICAPKVGDIIAQYSNGLITVLLIVLIVMFFRGDFSHGGTRGGQRRNK